MTRGGHLRLGGIAGTSIVPIAGLGMFITRPFIRAVHLHWRRRAQLRIVARARKSPGSHTHDPLIAGACVSAKFARRTSELIQPRRVASRPLDTLAKWRTRGKIASRREIAFVRYMRSRNVLGIVAASAKQRGTDWGRLNCVPLSRRSLCPFAFPPAAAKPRPSLAAILQKLSWFCRCALRITLTVSRKRPTNFRRKLAGH